MVLCCFFYSHKWLFKKIHTLCDTTSLETEQLSFLTLNAASENFSFLPYFLEIPRLLKYILLHCTPSYHSLLVIINLWILLCYLLSLYLTSVIIRSEFSIHVDIHLTLCSYSFQPFIFSYSL
jgi:hypothetical protein